MNVRARQDKIIRCLRRSASYTTNQLAEEIGASRRTIMRDIQALRSEGYIIYAEPGPGGGIQLDTRSVQTTTKLSVSEVFALLVSVTSMRAAGILPFAQLADSGLEKIERSLASETQRSLRRFLDCLYIGTLAPEVNTEDVVLPNPELLPAFEEAFLNQQYLRFKYIDAQGSQSVRKVESQAILILPPIWYLVAWDPSRQDFRHFRMDRISQPRLVAEKTFMRRHVTFADGVEKVRR